MTDGPQFFTIRELESIHEVVLGTADFVSRPIIILTREELTQYIDTNEPPRLVINFKNVRHISSEFISTLIHIQDHVVGHDGVLKLSHMNSNVLLPFKITNLAGRLFQIYESTAEAIDAF